MQSEARLEKIGIKNRKYKYQLVNYVLEEIQRDNSKIGVLFCEGDDTGIDKSVYSAVFPEFIVVSVGGLRRYSKDCF